MWAHPKRVWSLQHCPRRSDFSLSNGARGFDIDDHTMVGVDQEVIGIGEEGVSLMCAVHCAAGSERAIISASPARRLRTLRRRAWQSTPARLGGGFLDHLGLPLAAWNRSLLLACRNQACVDRKPVGADQALCNATLHTLSKSRRTHRSAKAPVSVLENVE